MLNLAIHVELVQNLTTDGIIGVNYLHNDNQFCNAFSCGHRTKFRFPDLKMNLFCIIMLCISIGQSVHRGKTLVLNQPAVLFFILTVFHLPPLSYSSIPPPFLSSTAPFIFPPSASRATQPISRRDPEPFKGQVIQGHWRVRPADWLTSARTSAVSQSHAGVSHSSLPPSLAGLLRHVT